MCGSSSPPPPDPGIAAAAQGQLELGHRALDVAKGEADAQTALGKEYLDLTKNQFQVSQDQQAKFDKQAEDTSTFYKGLATEDRNRWDQVFKPLQDQFIKTANEYDTPAKQEEMAAQAKADVLTAGNAEQGAQERRMEAQGVNPAAGAYQGIGRAVGLGTAVASADAQNKAREAVRNKALDLKTAAINMGAGLPAQASTEAGSALSAGAQPLAQLNASQGIIGAGYGGALGANANAAATTGGAFKTAASTNNSAGDILNSQYKTNVTAWDDQQKLAAQEAAGIGNFAGQLIGGSKVGGASGLGLMFLSSKKAKTNRKDVPEGESLDAVNQMPVQSYDYKPGMGDGGSHVGPMAEDFAKATGRGDGKQIAAQDAIGVVMGAVKDLDKKVNRIAKAVGIGGGKRPAHKFA